MFTICTTLHLVNNLNGSQEDCTYKITCIKIQTSIHLHVAVSFLKSIIACTFWSYWETIKGPKLSYRPCPWSSQTRSCFTPSQNSSLAAHPSTYLVQVVNTLSFLFPWYSPYLSVWPSSCLLSIKASPLLLWLKNSIHSAHKDWNIWTSLLFLNLSVWNSLPHEIRHIQFTTALKTALKTHLFKS